jgi:hypothetical protein
MVSIFALNSSVLGDGFVSKILVIEAVQCLLQVNLGTLSAHSVGLHRPDRCDLRPR